MKTAWVIMAGILCVLAGLGWNLFQIYQHGLDTEKYFGLRKSELLRLIEINRSIIDYLDANRDRWNTPREFGQRFRESFEILAAGRYDTVKGELQTWFNNEVNQRLRIESPRRLRQKLSEDEKTAILQSVRDVNEKLAK